MRGIQRGAYTFSLSTALAAIDLTNRLVGLINVSAQFANDVFTPPMPDSHRQLAAGRFSRTQPRDFREGVTVAYTVIREGLNDRRHNIATASHNSTEMSARIGEVVRQIPATIVCPVILISNATSSMLLGIRNQLTPEARKEDEDMYKNPNER